MAKKDRADDESLSPPISPLRDNRFVRLSADVSFCVNLPHGVEIALLQRTSAFKDIVMSDQQPVSAVQGNILTDIARIRMDDGDAIAMAFNILNTIAESGIVDVAAFDNNAAVVRKVIEDSAKRSAK